MKRALLVLLAACSSHPEPERQPEPPLRAQARPPASRTVPRAPRPSGDAPRAHGAGPVIPSTARQLITGVVADWDATRVTLRRWRREDGAWRADGEPWQGVIGKTGAAWGHGLHGAGAPEGRGGPIKREGDGKSPAGVFELRGAYGYAAKAPRNTLLPYAQLTADWQCIDDPGSRHYTQLVDLSRGIVVDWTSAEQMRRADALYTWVIDVAHNRSATPGAGSCIFFHVWRGPSSPTVGCTAMAERALTALMRGLDPAAVYVLLPRAEYDAFAAPWGLPRGEK